MSTARIRPAERRDLPDLVRIYNGYVRDTHITFDTRELTVDERRAWFDGFAESGPHRLLVAEVEDGCAGYASSQRLRPKPAYGQSVETTIYLDPAFAGRGIGHRLYEALFDTLRDEESVHRAFAGVALPNAKSIEFHERFGFRLIGTFHQVGFKFDKYWDVSWYERAVASPHTSTGG